MKYDVLIIGGGAAGLVAAISAAGQGALVLLLEHKDRVGKKLLATGNGRCNYTNRVQEPACYRGEHPEAAWEALKHFGVEETIGFFERLGICPLEKNGYLYPASEQASAVLDVLRMECVHKKVEVLCGVHVTGIKKQGRDFLVETAARDSFYAANVILCTGGKAGRVHGSDGSGYALAEKLGHRLITPVPALTSLYLKGDYMKGWAGVRTAGTVAVYIEKEEKPAARETGELQMVDYGISGIPVFQVCRFAAKALAEKKEVRVQIDFFPAMTEAELYLYLQKRLKEASYKTLEQQMTGLFHKKLGSFFLKQAGIRGKEESRNVTGKRLSGLCGIIKGFTAQVTGTGDFDKAQVTAGGVDTGEISIPSMESKKVKHFYLAGEVLDIDGTCGGYNLQWAWSTGYLAGSHAGRNKKC